MLPTPRKVIVVGASSGIGAELVRQFAARGDQVAALARREDLLATLVGQNVKTYVHDVTNYAEIPAVFQKITGDLGGLDIIVYAAGVMPAVGPDEFNFSKDASIIEVNVMGGIAWCNEAARRFMAAGHGTIVGIGSVAGDRGRFGQPVYNTSKAALTTFLEALRNRLSTHGVNVVTIKPGPVATEMTASLNLKNAMPVEQAAAIILTNLNRNGEFYLSFKHKIIFAILRNIPSPVFRKLKI